MKSVIKNLAFVLGFALILWFGYMYFFSGSDDILEESSTQNQAVIEGQEFLARIQELRELELDDSVFADLRFRTLIDYRQPLIPEPYGRTNPFESTGTLPRE